MIRLPIRQLQPGMVLAMPLYGPDGRILLGAGVVLKEAYIERLSRLGFTGAYVRDGVADDVPPDAPITEETRLAAMAAVRQTFAELGREGPQARMDSVRRAVDSILDELLRRASVTVGLAQVRSADDYTFAHSVDVAVMAVVCGMAMGFGRPRLFELGMGALLHDIGKVRIGRAILTKPGPLSPQEAEDMKMHTVYGFEMLRGRLDVSAVAAAVAYQHHERNDGTGYPRGLREPQIHPLAQVVAVVDVFDAMTSDRVYRRGVPLHEAARFLARAKGRLFNAMAVDRFLSRVSLYPMGAAVRLNTGEIALVVRQNDGNRLRPVVRVVADGRGRALKRPIEVDLALDTERAIAGMARWEPPAAP